jgi:hypothetical protein
LFVELLLVFWAERGFAERDHNLVEHASELKRHMLIFADGSTSVFADIEGLIRRNAELIVERDRV